MINIVDLNLNVFKEFNFMLYEQRFFQNMIELYDGNQIEYKYIGEDVFKNKKFCPLLVDLNTVGDELKESFLNEFILVNFTKNIYDFDRMFIAQNLFKSKLDLNDMAEFLTQQMIVGKSDKFLFRFYDPRISLHLNAILFDENKIYKNMYNGWGSKFLKNIDKYLISLNFTFMEINLSERNINFRKNMEVGQIESINKEIRVIVNDHLSTKRKLLKDSEFLNIVLSTYKNNGVV